MTSALERFMPSRRSFLMAGLLSGLLAFSACVHLKPAGGGGYMLSPTARSGAAAIVVGDSIYMAGGETLPELGADGGAYLRSVMRAPIMADGSVGAWTEQPPLDFPRGHASMVAHNGAVYVVGGSKDNNAASSGTIPTVLRALVQPDGNLAPWTVVRDGLNVTRGSAHVANNALFVLGGVGGSGSPSDKVLRMPFDAEGGLGQPVIAGTLAAPRNRGTSVMTAAGIFLLGGYRGGWPSAYDDSVERVTWSEGSPTVLSELQDRMPIKRGGAASAVVGSAVVVAGGFDGFRYSDRIDVATLNEKGQLVGWKQAGSLKAPRANFAMVQHGTSLYVIGGGNAAGQQTEVERIDLTALGIR